MGNKSEVFGNFLHKLHWQERYVDIKPERAQETSPRIL